MANPAALQKRSGKYLWFGLLGLGFQPDTATMSVADKSNINAKHINLGPNMFDKPNKDAFHIVTHFLLEKLNPARSRETYRHCWPVWDHKRDAEFRKVTCTWLREIMDEASNAGPKVVASLFLSPGGPKFTSLMLNLANHVMLQDMKTFTTDDSWVPEAAATPASSLDMAAKRLDLVTARFLKTAAGQDHFLHAYQRRAQLLVKSMRDLRAEGAKYNELLKRHSAVSPEGGAPPAEKIDKLRQVRSLWSTIDGMLSRIREERRAVESVLKGDVDQYVLDGTDRVLKIPRCLLERVEQLPRQLSSGNVYEAGQLNLRCALELMNHALQMLREERRRVAGAPKPCFSPALLQEKHQQTMRGLQNLHLIRQKISKEGIPEVSSSIRALEAEWDRKWKDTLKDTPLVSFLNEDPALDFLSPMAALSFEPVAEAAHGVFSQYPATLLEEKPAESKSQGGTAPRYSDLKSFTTAESPESPAVTTEAPSQANTSLDWLFDTPPSPPVRAPPPQASVRKTALFQTKATPKRTKMQIFDLECENLADQFAEAVTTSPSEGGVRGLDLEGLLNTLHGDPFSTRKQLPRTPESLIMDVKSSWRKALEEDRAEKAGRAVVADDSATGLLTPLEESVSLPLGVGGHGDAPVGQQGASSLRSSQLWDTFDSPSGTGSSAVQFSLDHETLPEMSSCDSLLSFSDEEEEEEELLTPSLKTEATTRRQPGDEGSFAESRKRSPDEGLVSEAADKVFSLDLDGLKTPPPLEEEFSLPELITFSPIDDMKC